MAISPRKHEIEAVMTAIEKEKSLEDVAKTATKAAFAALQSRPAEKEKLAQALWVVAVTNTKTLYGPFGTEAEAYAALEAGKVPDFVDDEGVKATLSDGLVPSLGGEAVVLPLIGPLAMAQRLDRQDRSARLHAEHRCAACEHQLAKHSIRPGSDACSIPGCRCSKPKEIKL